MSRLLVKVLVACYLVVLSVASVHSFTFSGSTSDAVGKSSSSSEPAHAPSCLEAGNLIASEASSSLCEMVCSVVSHALQSQLIDLEVAKEIPSLVLASQHRELSSREPAVEQKPPK